MTAASTTAISTRCWRWNRWTEPASRSAFSISISTRRYIARYNSLPIVSAARREPEAPAAAQPHNLEDLRICRLVGKRQDHAHRAADSAFSAARDQGVAYQTRAPYL